MTSGEKSEFHADLEIIKGAVSGISVQLDTVIDQQRIDRERIDRMEPTFNQLAGLGRAIDNFKESVDGLADTLTSKKFWLKLCVVIGVGTQVLDKATHLLHVLF